MTKKETGKIPSVTMHSTSKERLDSAALAALAALKDEHGAEATARIIGVDKHTLARAAAGWPVSFPIRLAIRVALAGLA